MSEIKLKRCPFCGGEEIEETYYSFMPVLKCKICGAIMTFPTSFRGNYRKELARKWNTRKPMQEIVERLEEMKGDCVKVYSEYLDGEDLRRAMLLEEVQMVVKEVGGMNDSKN